MKNGRKPGQEHRWLYAIASPLRAIGIAVQKEKEREMHSLKFNVPHHRGKAVQDMKRIESVIS